MEQEKIFNTETAEQQRRRLQGTSLYLSHDKRARFDALARVLGFSKPGALLGTMIEFFEKTMPGERTALLQREIIS